MYDLKALSKSAIPAALAQAERYRLLNEPAEAESICLDILRLDPDEYKRLYITGIIRERRGKAVLRSDRPGSGRSAHAWLKEAMACYEKAEAIRPAGNDEAVLRWNTCARLLMSMPVSEPEVHEFSAIQSE